MILAPYVYGLETPATRSQACLRPEFNHEAGAETIDVSVLH